MKRPLLLFLFFVNITCATMAQADLDDLSKLLAEGYTVTELKSIYTSITYTNYQSWLKKNGFVFKQSHSTKLQEFTKNEVVSLGVFVDATAGKIAEIFFHSSPQKFYKALATIKEDAAFKPVKSSKPNVTKWYRDGYIYYSNDDSYNIGIYKDGNNEAAGNSSNNVAASKADPVPPAYVPAKFDLSTAQKFADVLNANMNRAYIGATGVFNVYSFAVAGKLDVNKKSVCFVEKDGALYVKMNIPMNGDCDYGIKTVKATFINNCTLGMNDLCVKLALEYDCNGKKYEGLTVAFPRTGEDYKKEDLYHAIVARFRDCCKK